MDIELSGSRNKMHDDHPGLEQSTPSLPTFLHFSEGPTTHSATFPFTSRSQDASHTEHPGRSHSPSRHDEFDALRDHHLHQPDSALSNHATPTTPITSSESEHERPSSLSINPSNLAILNSPLSAGSDSSSNTLYPNPTLSSKRHAIPVKNLSRWASLTTQIKGAVSHFFQRNKLQSAKENIELAEHVLEDDPDPDALDIYIKTLFQKRQSHTTQNNQEIDLFIQECKTCFQSSQQVDEKSRTVHIAPSPLSSPPTRSASAASAKTLVGPTDPKQDSESGPFVNAKAAQLALIDTIIEVCNGDAALSQATLKRLKEPLYDNTEQEKKEKVESVDSDSLKKLLDSVSEINEDVAKQFKNDKSLDWMLKNTPAFGQELIAQFRKNRVDEVALKCAQTLLKRRDLGLYPLLAWQCKKEISDLNMHGCTQEAALAVYLQTGPLQSTLPLKETLSEAKHEEKEHAQWAHDGAKKILNALHHQYPITLQTESDEGSDSDDRTLSIEEWTAFLTWQWGYDKAALKKAIACIFKANSTWINRAKALREPVIKLKEAKQALKDSGLFSASKIKGRLEAQWDVFKAYRPQMHWAGHNKTPYWVSRKIFFSQDHAIGAEKAAYKAEINSALGLLESALLKKLEILKGKDESAANWHAMTDTAFAYAKVQAWQQLENKGNGKIQKAHAQSVAEIVETTLKQLATDVPAYFHFLVHQKKYTKGLHRSWIPFLSKHDFFSVQKMHLLAEMTFESIPGSQKDKEAFDATLTKALKYSRAAPLLGASPDIHEAAQINTSKDQNLLLKPHQISSNNLETYLRTRHQAFMTNATPGSSHATSNGNLTGFNSGPYLPTPIPFLLPSVEIGAEYGLHASSEITVNQTSVDITWGRGWEAHGLLGGGAYYGFLKRLLGTVDGPVAPSVGVSASANIKIIRQHNHKTILRTEHQANRQARADETLQLLNKAITASQKDSTSPNDHSITPLQHQKFLHHFTRECFDKPHISLNEQFTHSTRISGNIALQTSAYGGSNASKDLPSLGGLMGLYTEAKFYDTSHTVNIQHGQHRQHAIRQEQSAEVKTSLSLGTFIPVIPLRLPTRVDLARISLMKRLSLVTLMDKTIWSRGKAIRLTHAFSNTLSPTHPPTLAFEVKRPKLTKGWFNKLDRQTTALWSERYGPENIEEILENCTPEPKGQWVLRECFKLRDEYYQKVSWHMAHLEALTDQLAKLQAHAGSHKTSKIRDCEANITATLARIEEIYEGSYWEPTALEVDLITTKSRSRGPNMLAKFQRQENERLIERKYTLKPLSLEPVHDLSKVDCVGAPSSPQPTGTPLWKC